MSQPIRPALTLALGLMVVTGAPLSAQRTEKLQGYAEFVKGDALVVDGQRIVADAGTRFSGRDMRSLTGIPLGYEVKVQGRRRADGALVASRVEARPNGQERYEAEAKAGSDEVEQAWVSRKMMYEPRDSGKIVKIGDILESGPYVDRARRIMGRIRPAYVPAGELRVRVVETDEWNASAMANGAIWVFTGLMDSMSDDEMAVVLGHELAHYTHEHVRRNAGRGTLAQILGVGAAVAASQIGDGAAQQAVALGGQLGLSAFMSGYSRDLEDQADRVGLRYVYEAGYDVATGPTIWGKFRQKYGEQDKVTNFFAGSHSRPSDRIRNIERDLSLNYRVPSR
jgi:Zn-dependent protease with chaperone function